MSYRNDVTQELHALKREASHVLTTGTRRGSSRIGDDGTRFAADHEGAIVPVSLPLIQRLRKHRSEPAEQD